MNPQTTIKAAWATWAAIWLALNFAPSYRTREVADEQEYTAQAMALIGLVVLLGNFGPTFIRVPERLRGWLAWAVVAALGFSVWARLELGPNWSGVSVERVETVTTGPYELVKHPIYLGTGIAAFLTAPALGNVSAGAGAAVLIVALAAKAFAEEENAPV